MTHIKICGVTTLEDALLCAEAGADLLGLNFYPDSPRYITPKVAQQITIGLRERLGDRCPVLVGVFVNADMAAIKSIMHTAGLDVAQLNGDEAPEFLTGLDERGFKAIRPRNRKEAHDLAGAFRAHAPENERLPALLVDAYHDTLYGGTGEQANVAVARAAQEITPRLMLAGGLTPENVAERARAIRPWGVDVASGCEHQPGHKDPARVQAFVAAVRSVMEFTIDTLQAADWPEVAEIYREGIATGHATFEVEVPEWEVWQRDHLAGHEVDCRLVARSREQVLGWAALTPVSGRCVYAGVAEVSVYVAAAARGQDIGTALLRALIAASEANGIWTLQAGIFPENQASIALHRACGFREVGRRERLGELNGVWRDVIILERRSRVTGV